MVGLSLCWRRSFIFYSIFCSTVRQVNIFLHFQGCNCYRSFYYYNIYTLLLIRTCCPALLSVLLLNLSLSLCLPSPSLVFHGVLLYPPPPPTGKPLIFFSPDVFCLLTSISSVVTSVGLCCAGLLIKQSVHTLSHMQFQWTHTQFPYVLIYSLLSPIGQKQLAVNSQL